MTKLKIAGIVSLIFLFAYFLRVMHLPQNILTFGYDQARDAVNALQILSGDIKIQGPPASTPGLYHGVFYYYVLAAGYAFGSNPVNAAYLIAFLNALTVFVIFYLGYLISGKKYFAGLSAAFLFAVSFESTQYATWLSNPTIAVLTVPVFYLGLWLWLKEKNKWGTLLAALGLGLSIQAEVFLVYHLVPLAVWLWISRKNILKKEFLIFASTFLISVSTMILNEIKFGFRSLEGIRQLALAADANLAYAKSVGDYLILYLNQIGRIFAFNSYPGNVGYGGVLVIVLGIIGMGELVRLKKMTGASFVSLWLFSHLSVVTVGGTSTPFLMVGIGPAVSIALALFLLKIWEKKYKYLVLALLAVFTYGNLSMILRENKNGSTLFAIQKDMILSKELAAVDFTYARASGNPFTLNSVNSPLWINIVWSYLYNWYGESKYGYVPEYHGRSQIGQVTALPEIAKRSDPYFLILEPMGGIPEKYLVETLGEEDLYSAVAGEKYFGELRVQERELK